MQGSKKAHLACNLQFKVKEVGGGRIRPRLPFKEIATGRYTAAEFKALCEEYGNLCLRYGDRDAPFTWDHVIPLSLGGSNWISNIRPLCRRYKSRKNLEIVDY